MAEIGHLLETLHPLREPPPPDPIVPYLAVVALGCAAALVVLLAALLLRRRRRALQRYVEAQLKAVRPLAPDERLAAQAGLLRRLARQLGGEEAARAQGDAWLARLDQLFATCFFTQGAGRVFAERLYARPSAVDVDGLDRALIDLVAKVRVG